MKFDRKIEKRVLYYISEDQKALTVNKTDIEVQRWRGLRTASGVEIEAAPTDQFS